MDSFEINKIIGAILLTALIVIGLGKFTDFLFHVDKPEQSAYKIEGLEAINTTSSTVEEKVEEKVDIVQLLSMGEIDSWGEKFLKKCSACHMIAADGKNMIGIQIFGV